MKRELLEEYSIHRFFQKHNIKTEEGLPLDFRAHRFMFQVYSDMVSLERDVAGMKAAQVTFTTTATNAVLYIAKNRHIDIIYTLPTFDDVRQFVGGKVNRIIAQNPIYQSWVKDKDTIEHKAVGDNIIYFRGTHTTKSATMVSSDLNVYDEVDSSNQRVIEQYATRLQHSDLKRQWYFSHPSVPGNGVDKYWKRSDQKHWFVKCEHCRKWQFLAWPQSICQIRGIYQCKFCFGPMSDTVRRMGQWVAKDRSKSISGYLIPLLICPWVSATEILKYHREKPADYFYNKVLGLPYVGAGNAVTQQHIYQNLRQGMPDLRKSRIVIGVDPGETIRYVIGTSAGIFKYGTCKNYDELKALLRGWERAIMVIDEGGDIIGPREMRKEFKGRVFLCHYQRDRKTLQLIKWGDNDEFGHVTVDRNRMIQLIVDELSDRKFPLWYLDTPDDYYDYWLHWSHIYRVAEEDKMLNQLVYRWERSDRDDFVHATVYWKVGISRFGGKGTIIKNEIPKGEVVNSYNIIDGKTDAMPQPVQKMLQSVEQANRGAIVGVDDDMDEWRL